MTEKASLDGPFAKLRRAKEHLEAFKVEADRIAEYVPQTTSFEARYDPDVPRFLVHVADEPVVPFHLSTIAGDLCHNLRSGLDLLAYQLPILATGEAWEGAQWPIVDKPRDIGKYWRFSGLRKEMIRGGRRDLWAKVEGYQSFGYEQQMPPPEGVDMLTQRYRDLPLFVLRELSNMDKHRLLLGPYFNVAELRDIRPQCIHDCVSPRVIESWGFFYTLKKDAAPIVQFAVDATGPDPEMKVDVDFTAQPVSLSFLPGPAREWLELLVATVSSVLEDFAPDF